MKFEDEIRKAQEDQLNHLNSMIDSSDDDIIEKAKYFKREGTSGNYRYYYTEEQYKKMKGNKQSSPSDSDKAKEEIQNKRDREERFHDKTAGIYEEAAKIAAHAGISRKEYDGYHLGTKKELYNNYLKDVEKELKGKKEPSKKENDKEESNPRMSIGNYRKLLLDRAHKTGDSDLADYSRSASIDNLKRRYLSENISQDEARAYGHKEGIETSKGTHIGDMSKEQKLAAAKSLGIKDPESLSSKELDKQITDKNIEKQLNDFQIKKDLEVFNKVMNAHKESDLDTFEKLKDILNLYNKGNKEEAFKESKRLDTYQRELIPPRIYKDMGGKLTSDK